MILPAGVTRRERRAADQAAVAEASEEVAEAETEDSVEEADAPVLEVTVVLTEELFEQADAPVLEITRAETEESVEQADAHVQDVAETATNVRNPPRDILAPVESGVQMCQPVLSCSVKLLEKETPPSP